MFGTQAMRLMRTTWKSTQALAEELYAMFQDQNPVETGGGLTVSAPPGVAPLTVNGETPTGKGETFTFGHNDGTGDALAPWQKGPDISFYGDNFVFSSPGVPPIPSAKLGSGSGGSGSGGGVPGKVVSGAGSAYTVTIYPGGLGKPGKTVSCTQLGIDENAKIPPDTWAVVSSVTVNGKPSYFMQVPVWGADPS